MFLSSYSILPVLAQQESLFKGLPQNSQGYLIWKNDNPLVKYWTVRIVQKKHDSSLAVGYSEKDIKKFEIWGKNYLKLDKSLWNINTPGVFNYVILEGSDDSGNLVLSKEHILETGYAGIGTPIYNRGCDWRCISGDYAYKIQQFTSIDNPDQGHYSIQPTYHYSSDGTGTQIPFFRYFDETEINVYTNNFDTYVQSGGIIGYDAYNNPIYQPGTNNPQFHGGLTQWNQLNYTTSFSSFDQFNQNQGQYLTIDGIQIVTPTVYQLKKYTGWWRVGNIRVPAIGEFQINDDCLNELDWAVNLINSPLSNLAQIKADNTPVPSIPEHQDNVIDLKCDVYPGTGLGGGNIGTSYWDCFYSAGFLDFVGFEIEDNDDAVSYWDYLAEASNCLSSGDLGTSYADDGVTAEEAISHVEIFKLVKIGNELNDSICANFSHSDLIDEDGNYIQGSNHILSLGLYKMIYKYPSTGVSYIVFENNKKVSSTLPLSGFVNATIFPVPLQNDHEFNIQIQTTASSRFRYDLLDSNGSLIYSEYFDVPKDHDETHRIVSEQPIPKGILINHFIFNDGSDFSITTNKLQ